MASAKILAVKLGYLKDNIARRRKNAAIYLKKLSSIRQISLPEVRPGTEHSWHLFVIKAEDRDGLQKFLKEKEIDSLIHYPIPIHKQKCFPEHNADNLPATEARASTILSLPIHPSLTEEQVLYVCDQVRSFYEKS